LVFKVGAKDVGLASLGFHRGWFINHPRKPTVLIFHAHRATFAAVIIAFLAIGLSSEKTFAQGLGPGPATIVPAIPELSPSSTEAEGLFKLASRLEAGDSTLARDDVLARRLYRIAADAGHAGAQCNLGAMLMDGSGGPTDLAGGAALFRKAALRGHGLAQYNLGVMHALGDGVVKDSGEAMAWIEQAINRLPEGEAMASAKAWREHLRNRMSSREGMIARSRSQELGEAIMRELAAASTGSASRAARSAIRSGMDELGVSPEGLQRLGLAASGAALAVGSVANVGGNQVSGSHAGGNAVASRTVSSPVASNNGVKTVANPAAILPTVPVETVLREWLKAWSDRRADDYLNFYDPGFAPLGGVDRATWAKQRRNAIRHPSWVKVRAEQISTTEMSPEEIVVSFVQVYSASTGHRETTRKSMIWRWSDGHWRIVSEQATRMAGASGREVEVVPTVEPAQPVEVKAQREAEAQQLRVRRDEEAAAARAKRETELANVRAEMESKQAAVRAAREVQLSAEKAAREAELEKKEAKRLARELLSAPPGSPDPTGPPMTPSAALAPAPAEASSATPSIAPNPASFELTVRAWVKAWNDRKVDAYLAFYSPSFEIPGGQDRSTWASQRSESMTRPAWIKVRADQLKTSVNGDSAEARFFQVYVVAPGTVELLKKTMRWVWTDGRWQIVQEQTEPMVRKHGAK